MTETLAQKKCTPCRGGIPPLTHEEAERFQSQTPRKGAVLVGLVVIILACVEILSGSHVW
jgi:hypothetical protein